MNGHEVVQAVCDLVAHETGDPTTLIENEVRRLAPLAPTDLQTSLSRQAIAQLRGLGELDVYVRDDTIDEVLVNAGREIWIDRGGTLYRVGELRVGSIDLVIERMLAPLGRRVDRTSPIVDARLAAGARVCAVLPPVAVDGPMLSIRRFRQRVLSLDAFTDPSGCDVVRQLLQARCNVVVSGATSSGKSSLIAAPVSYTHLRDHET